MTRLPVSFVVAAASLLALAFVLLRDSFDSQSAHNALWAPGSIGHTSGDTPPHAPDGHTSEDAALARTVELGDVIMPKLPNATAKAELGRASWKLLHTMAARFPEDPTSDQREAFQSWLYLFSRLYPCGECAAEFQLLLRQHPPQTSSRGAASLYLCHLHNLVNARLGKDEYDCGENLKDVYDCGCGDEEEKERERARVDKEKETGKRGSGDAHATEEEEGSGRKRDPATGLELVGG